MGRRGPKQRLDVEADDWRLVLSGMGTVEACRVLGIGRKTGYRWRAEHGGRPPERLDEHQRHSRYLSLLERQRIATLRERGLGVREIAGRLGRSPSTISRELRRSTFAHDRGIYDADLAHARARQRLRRERGGRLLQDPQLRAQVAAMLELEWSPEQIAAWLRTTFLDLPHWHVCHKTIYQAIYYSGISGLGRKLSSRLRTGRSLCRRRRRPDQRTPRFVAEGWLLPAPGRFRRPCCLESCCSSGRASNAGPSQEHRGHRPDAAS
jgi:transposase, IS30 family